MCSTLCGDAFLVFAGLSGALRYQDIFPDFGITIWFQGTSAFFGITIWFQGTSAVLVLLYGFQEIISSNYFQEIVLTSGSQK